MDDDKMKSCSKQYKRFGGRRKVWNLKSAGMKSGVKVRKTRDTSNAYIYEQPQSAWQAMQMISTKSRAEIRVSHKTCIHHVVSYSLLVKAKSTNIKSEYINSLH